MSNKIQAIADQFADAVREAFVEIYGKPSSKDKLASVRPSWSEVSVKQGWVDPHPGIAVVGTEYAWIDDPYASAVDQVLWDRVMRLLRDRGWENVAYESINAAVHIVYWLPPKEWLAILSKRTMDRSRR